MSKLTIGLLLCLAFLSIFPACKKDKTNPAPTVISTSSNVADAIAQYKSMLGPDRGGVPGTQGVDGFREVNWDGLTDEESAPNLYSPELFNAPTAPRARGLVLSTPGTGLMVSADS
ncbi:MAG: hypothetical protein JNN28_02730, partial [Saprospiraceae bacterium]|nr:hypothetical protein [Saprospiraceae bacterium]